MKEILHYFPDISQEQKQQFEQLEEIYKYWNERINLISRKDIDALYTNHVLHSLSIAKFIKFNSQSSILDVGTGGGFPGIPLSIMFPEAKFHLIDSIAKKIMVVNDVIDKLNLKNCSAKQIRAEQTKEKFDFVVSRAVTQLPKFYNWVKNNISKEQKHPIKNGIIYLKGGNLTEEISSLKKRTSLTPISKYFNEGFFETKQIVYVCL